MVCNVQSTGMMRGIVREATVQLVPRGLLRGISSKTMLLALLRRAIVLKSYTYIVCVSYRDMQFENEVKASGGLEKEIRKMVMQI
jgi:hypothetical protein